MKLSNFKSYLLFILISIITYSVLYYFGWKELWQEESWTSPTAFAYQLSLLPGTFFLIWLQIRKQ